MVWLGSNLSMQAQHNPIFGGASNDGFSQDKGQTETQNGIYDGGVNDGYGSETQSSQTNGTIFTGGVNDGYGLDKHQSATNGSIFTGGVNDGYGRDFGKSASHNGIFTGGVNDGYARNFAATQSNNGIFTGGVNDGYDSQRSSDIVQDEPNLPIELLFFDAYVVGEDVQIEWETVTEINNDYFTVERAENPARPEDLIIVPGQGNSEFSHQYAVLDKDPLPGVSYYRLRQTDFDGTETHSDWVAVKFEIEFDNANDIQIYPNPVTGTYFEIKATGFDGKEAMEIYLVDMNGRQIQKLHGVADDKGAILQRVEISESLPGGTYGVVMSGKGGLRSGKVIVLR